MWAIERKRRGHWVELAGRHRTKEAAEARACRLRAEHRNRVYRVVRVHKRSSHWDGY